MGGRKAVHRQREKRGERGGREEEEEKARDREKGERPVFLFKLFNLRVSSSKEEAEEGGSSLTDDGVGVVGEVAQAALQAPETADTAAQTETGDGRTALVLAGAEKRREAN